MPVSAASSETLLLFQEFPQHFHTRRLLLLHTPLYQPPPPATANSHHNPPEISAGESSTFDANVVMVLSVLLCALICSLGLNSIVRCALRCSSLIATESSGSGDSPSSARLANTGIKKKALKTFPTLSYAAAGLKMPGLDTECAICLSEFMPGEHIRLLPKCNHGFHVRCIDKWLNSHSSCPTCRHCLIQTCQKRVGCSSQEQFSSSAPHETETIVSIAPLEREGLIHNTYQGINS